VKLAEDPAPSLYIANEPIRIDGLPSMNRFYRNVDGTGFVPTPEMGLDRSEGGGCALATNLDNDADDELLACVTEGSGSLGAGGRLYDFDGTRFVNRTTELGLRPIWEVDLEAADLNADGAVDIVQMRTDRLVVNLGGTSGYSSAFKVNIPGARAMAIGDVNDDQRPDIFVASIGDDVLLVNEGDGRSFATTEVPDRGGSADEVLALDYDRNGLSDFITLNGRTSPGPITLTAFFPSL